MTNKNKEQDFFKILKEAERKLMIIAQKLPVEFSGVYVRAAYAMVRAREEMVEQLKSLYGNLEEKK